MVAIAWMRAESAASLMNITIYLLVNLDKKGRIRLFEDFFLSKNFSCKSPKRANKHIRPSVSIFVVMKEDRRAEMDCLWLFKSKDDTKLGA